MPRRSLKHVRAGVAMHRNQWRLKWEKFLSMAMEYAQRRDARMKSKDSFYSDIYKKKGERRGYRGTEGS